MHLIIFLSHAPCLPFISPTPTMCVYACMDMRVVSQVNRFPYYFSQFFDHFLSPKNLFYATS